MQERYKSEDIRLGLGKHNWNWKLFGKSSIPCKIDLRKAEHKQVKNGSVDDLKLSELSWQNPHFWTKVSLKIH